MDNNIDNLNTIANMYENKYRIYKEKYNTLKQKINSFKFTDNLIWRRAEKHFLPGDIDVSRVEQAIINAPSSYGLQPFKVLKITELSTKEKIKPACFNQSQITECHTLYIFCALRNLEERIEDYIKQTGFVNKNKYMLEYIVNKSKVPDQVEWAKQQAYLALGFGLAAATEQKIASCPMEGFKPYELSKLLDLDNNLVPCVLFALGRKKDGYELEKRFRFKDIIESIN
jgi:nitroreductase/dihydropteridine reductase